MSTTALNSFRNIGNIDAIIRALISIAMIATVLLLNLNSAVSAAIALISIPTMIFAILRWDPIYSACHFSTDSNKLRA